MNAALTTLFFFSGLGALALEVVWSRVLHRLLGSGTLSVTVVLSAFFLGSSLGALLAQRILRRRRRPAVRLFAAAELLAALVALLVSFLLGRMAGMVRAEGGELVALLLVALASLPAGAGLPILVRALDPAAAAPRTVSLLYGVNALGGAAGGLLAGLGGIPSLGENAVLALAVALEVLVAVGATLAARRGEPAGEGIGPEATPSLGAASLATERREDSAAPRPAASWGGLAAYSTLGGAVVLYWEVLWTRLLVLTVGSNVYAFSFVASSVVLGIGAGSLALGGRRFWRLGGWLLPLLAASWTAGAYFLVPRLPDAYLLAVRATGTSPLVCGTLGAGAIAFLPTFLLGSLFPWAVSRRVSATGTFFAVNGLGCIAGALLAGPVGARLVPLEGSYRIGVGAMLLLAAAGAWIRAAERARPESAGGEHGDRPPGPAGKRAAWGLAALAGAAVLAGAIPAAGGRGAWPQWDPERLTTGVYQWALADLARPEALRENLEARELLAYEEGREAIVSVELNRARNTIYVCANGKAEGTLPADPSAPSGADLPTQILLGVIPAYLRSERPDAPGLLIGLGSGVSAGALVAARRELGARVPVDVVEIEPAFLVALRRPEVRPFAQKWFDPEVDSREVRLWFGDARRVLARELSERKFSFIASQPSEPWVSGSASLFTGGFFREAARRLDDGGVFVQWVQLYKIDAPGLLLLVRTFHSVFSRVTVVRPPGTGELLLLGSERAVDLGRLSPASALPIARHAGIRGELGWYAIYLLGPMGVDDWVGGDPEAPLNSDARGELEFRGPRSLHGGQETARRHLAAIRERGRLDPVTRYLPPQRREAGFLRRLALANVRLGDLPEAEAIVARDRSAEADAVRAAIREARDRPEAAGDR